MKTPFFYFLNFSMKKTALALYATATLLHGAENIPEMAQEINTQKLGIAERKEQIVALVSGDKYVEFNMTTGMMAYPLDNFDKKGGIILDETQIIEDENGKNDIPGLMSNFKDDLIELTYIGILPNGPITDILLVPTRPRWECIRELQLPKPLHLYQSINTLIISSRRVSPMFSFIYKTSLYRVMMNIVNLSNHYSICLYKFHSHLSSCCDASIRA